MPCPPHPAPAHRTGLPFCALQSGFERRRAGSTVASYGGPRYSAIASRKWSRRRAFFASRWWPPAAEPATAHRLTAANRAGVQWRIRREGGYVRPTGSARGLRRLAWKRAKRRLALERAKGIEPSYAAWEAAVLPLNYARAGGGTIRAPDGGFKSPGARFTGESAPLRTDAAAGRFIAARSITAIARRARGCASVPRRRPRQA